MLNSKILIKLLVPATIFSAHLAFADDIDPIGEENLGFFILTNPNNYHLTPETGFSMDLVGGLDVGKSYRIVKGNKCIKLETLSKMTNKGKLGLQMDCDNVVVEAGKTLRYDRISTVQVNSNLSSFPVDFGPLPKIETEVFQKDLIGNLTERGQFDFNQLNPQIVLPGIFKFRISLGGQNPVPEIQFPSAEFPVANGATFPVDLNIAKDQRSSVTIVNTSPNRRFEQLHFKVGNPFRTKYLKVTDFQETEQASLAKVGNYIDELTEGLLMASRTSAKYARYSSVAAYDFPDKDTLFFYPQFKYSRTWLVVINNLPIFISKPKPGENIKVYYTTVNINDVLVEKEDGSKEYFPGQVTAYYSKTGIANSWVDYRPLIENCGRIGEPNCKQFSFSTKVSLDLPRGYFYKFAINYQTKEGPKSAEYILDFSK